MPANTAQATVQRLTIVGGGFSSVVAAIAAMREQKTGEDFEIFRVERNQEALNAGVAYGMAEEPHVTNTSVHQMSVFPDKPNDLLEWLRTTDRTNWPAKFHDYDYDANPKAQVPRSVYRTYMEQRIQETSTAYGVAINEIPGEVIDAESLSSGNGVKVILRDGYTFETNQTILATGNTAENVPNFLEAVRSDPHVITDAYNPEERTKRAELIRQQDPGKPILLIGSALSSYDAALSLK